MARAAQRTMVMELLKEPHTIQELEDKIGGNYFAIYRVVKALEEEGLVLEQPWKRDRKNVYVHTTAAKAGVIMLHVKTGAFPLGSFLLPQGFNHHNLIRGAIAYLFRRSYHTTPVGEPEDVTKWRGGLAPIQVKEHVRVLRTAFENGRKMCDQLLLADVWQEDDRELCNKFGDLPAELQLVFDSAKYFEDVATGKVQG